MSTIENIDSLSKFYQYAFPMLTMLVTCIDKNQNPNIITISWHTTLSKKPPLYGISLAPIRHSYKLISETNEFVINFLSSRYINDVHFCGTHSGKKTDKTKHTDFTFIPSEKTSVPRIKEAYAHFECALIDTLSVGDHILLIGKILNASADKTIFDNNLLDITKIQPIYYRGGNSYTRLDKEYIQQF
jgi:flavin reductase (DIM6/NTAB) family NADH-FMN oxidoreductase RutF